MTQNDIIEVLAAQHDLPKATVKSLLDGIAGLAKANIKYGFTIPGIGKIVLAERKARKARNPRTGETIDVAGTTVPRMRFAGEFKKAVASHAAPAVI